MITNSEHKKETLTLDPLCFQVINSINAQVAVVNGVGDIVAANNFWKTYNQELENKWYRPLVGENFLKVLQKPLIEGDEFALRFLNGLKSILAGDRNAFEQTYSILIFGEKKWFKAIIKELNEGDGALIIQEDITSLVVNKQYIKETEQRFDHHFENNFYGILVVNSDFQIIEANKTSRSILEQSNEELVFCNLRKYLDLGKYSDIKTIHESIKSSGNYIGEFRLNSATGKIIPIELSATTFRNELGVPVISFAFKDVSSKKEIEEKLVSEQEFTKSAISSLPTAFFVFDESGKIVRWNRMLEEEFGYSASELDVMNVISLVHPEEQEKIKQYIQKGCPEKAIKLEVKCKSKSGKDLYYFVSGKSFSESGKIYIVGGALNLSDLKNVENEKRRNEELLTQLFHNSPIGIVLVDNNGLIKRTNKSFEHIFGYTNDEILNQDLDYILAPDKSHFETQGLTRCSFLGETFQKEAIRVKKDGTHVPVLVGGVPVKVDGEVISIFGMYVDISERNKLETQVLELLENEKKARIHLEEIFEEAPSAIALLYGKEHTYTFANEKFEELVGRNDLIGKDIDSVLPEFADQGFKAKLDSCFNDANIYHFDEQEIYFKNPSTKEEILHFLNFVFKPMFDDEKNVHGVFIEAVDVTEQVKARNTILQSLNEKETLLHEVHHRVKNNMAIISGLIELELMSSEDKNVLDRLNTTHLRITTIAKIHELLYQNDSLSHIPFHTYIKNVMMPEENEISVFNKFNLQEVSLNVNQAIPAGMLLNEIVSQFNNKCIKTKHPNCVDLKLSADDKVAVIELVDHCKLLFSHLKDSIESSDGLSFELIDVLLKQIQGNMSIELNDEHKIIITFERREAKGAYSALS